MTLDNARGQKVVIARGVCETLIDDQEKCDQNTIAIIWVPNLLAGQQAGGDWRSFCYEHALWQLQNQPKRRVSLKTKM